MFVDIGNASEVMGDVVTLGEETDSDQLTVGFTGTDVVIGIKELAVFIDMKDVCSGDALFDRDFLKSGCRLSLARQVVAG